MSVSFLGLNESIPLLFRNAKKMHALGHDSRFPQPDFFLKAHLSHYKIQFCFVLTEGIFLLFINTKGRDRALGVSKVISSRGDACSAHQLKNNHSTLGFKTSWNVGYRKTWK